MKSKRKPKKGYVYLLQCQKDNDNYKYGCTTLTPEKRCVAVNYSHKEYDFKVIAAFRSNDIFADEHNIRLNMLPGGVGVFGEFFSSAYDMTFTKEGIINDFLKAAGVIRG